MALYTENIDTPEYLSILTKSNLLRKINISFENQFVDVTQQLNNAYSKCSWEQTVVLLIEKQQQIHIHTIHKGILEEIYLDLKNSENENSLVKVIYELIELPLENVKPKSIQIIKDYFLVQDKADTEDTMSIKELKALIESYYQKGIPLNN